MQQTKEQALQELKDETIEKLQKIPDILEAEIKELRTIDEMIDGNELSMKAKRHRLLDEVLKENQVAKESKEPIPFPNAEKRTFECEERLKRLHGDVLETIENQKKESRNLKDKISFINSRFSATKVIGRLLSN